jgi:hypothetical protein
MAKDSRVTALSISAVLCLESLELAKVGGTSFLMPLLEGSYDLLLDTVGSPTVLNRLQVTVISAVEVR